MLSTSKTNHAFSWIVIYPVDRVIHFLNNLGQESKARSQVPWYFGICNFSFPDSKISLSRRNVFKSNLPVHFHPMISGFCLEKLGLHVVPPYYFIVRLETGHDFAPPSIRIEPSTPCRIRCGSVFSILVSENETIGISCRIRQTEAASGKCGQENFWIRKANSDKKNIRIRVDGA